MSSICLRASRICRMASLVSLNLSRIFNSKIELFGEVGLCRFKTRVLLYLEALRHRLAVNRELDLISARRRRADRSCFPPTLSSPGNESRPDICKSQTNRFNPASAGSRRGPPPPKNPSSSPRGSGLRLAHPRSACELLDRLSRGVEHFERHFASQACSSR